MTARISLILEKRAVIDRAYSSEENHGTSVYDDVI
jgi:hypothetical protein